MIDKDTTFILGAQGPEMREIERVLRSDRHELVHAAQRLWRGSARTAHDADGVVHGGPGDPGFEAGPDRYLEGSSPGQVLRLLKRKPTETQRLLAAGDHCLTAACQCACPGVDPNYLLELRAS